LPATFNATLVIGNHPHLIQAVEAFPNGVVAYSLGNFVFAQDPPAMRQGLIFEAVFHGAHLADWKVHPIHIYNLYPSHWARSRRNRTIRQQLDTLTTALPVH
jgi:poly-gamma-glutamate capsule biosynthesis protein CapA/YwtB (metallophosphatase superfamily)